MPNAELHRLSATVLARLVEGGELNAEAVMRSCLERIREREGVVRAWVHLDPGQALTAARECDRRGKGVRRGVPFGVKVSFDTERHALQDALAAAIAFARGRQRLSGVE